MDKPDVERQDEFPEQSKDIPLCLKCARPVDPMSHYCPHCGETTGQMTPYIPFVNLRMQVNFWVQSWHQVFSGEASFAGRCLRLLLILLLFPIILLAIPFILWERIKSGKKGGDL